MNNTERLINKYERENTQYSKDVFNELFELQRILGKNQVPNSVFEKFNRFNETIAECEEDLTSVSQCADLILQIRELV